jgi:hypothetical protein
VLSGKREDRKAASRFLRSLKIRDNYWEQFGEMYLGGWEEGIGWRRIRRWRK